MSEALPSVGRIEDVIPALRIWRNRLRDAVARPRSLAAPLDVRATSVNDGILIEWRSILGADGYEILATDTVGDFAEGRPLRVIPLNGANQNSYFDQLTVVGNPPPTVTRYYKVRGTSGSRSNPHSVQGKLSGVVNADMNALNLVDVTDGGGRYATGSASLNNRPLSNPLTSSDAGATATVSIAAFTLRVARPTGTLDISVNSGSITSLSFNTTYHIYYDDTDLAGGSVTFAATTTRETSLNGAGRIYVGSITTPQDGAFNTVGNNDGGVGGQYGLTQLYWPSAVLLNESISAPGKTADINSATSEDIAAHDITPSGESALYTLRTWINPVVPGFVKTVTLKIDTEVIFTQGGSIATFTARLRYSLNAGSSWTNIYNKTDEGRSRTLDSVTISLQDLATLRVEAQVTATADNNVGIITLKNFETYVVAET